MKQFKRQSGIQNHFLITFPIEASRIIYDVNEIADGCDVFVKI